jgi:hypothetical protein
MAFSRQEEMFDELLEQALQEKDIVDGINKTNIPEKIIISELRDIVKGKENDIWDLATIEIREWNNIEKEHLGTQEELKVVGPRFKRMKDESYLESDFLPKSRVRQFLMWLFRLCFYFLIIVLGIGMFTSGLASLSSTIPWVAITIIAQDEAKHAEARTD